VDGQSNLQLVCDLKFSEAGLLNILSGLIVSVGFKLESP